MRPRRPHRARPSGRRRPRPIGRARIGLDAATGRAKGRSRRGRRGGTPGDRQCVARANGCASRSRWADSVDVGDEAARCATQLQRQRPPAGVEAWAETPGGPSTIEAHGRACDGTMSGHTRRASGPRVTACQPVRNPTPVTRPESRHRAHCASATVGRRSAREAWSPEGPRPAGTRPGSVATILRSR
jgi:hypothetical protein